LIVARYEIRDATSGEVLSRHRTQGSIDAWRQRHAARRVAIVRTLAGGDERPVVEGYWHSTTADDDTP
jgi:hypothetical protein